MKKALLLAVLVASCATSAFADISVNGLSFNAGDAALGQIFFDTVGGTPADNTVKVDVLFGASAGSLTLGSSVFTIVNGQQGFLNAGTINVTTGSLGGGSAGFYQVRAWTGGASFADGANTKTGSSAVTAITFGGTPLGGGTAIAPPDLNLHASFAIVAVPEPATLALGFFGAAGLFIRRRK
ncbi:MAG: PEP-CTERM sorting domain-containing protein [Limisphaerales bacterium]